MLRNIHHILYHWTNKKSFKEVDEQSLIDLTNQYPECAAPHVLLNYYLSTQFLPLNTDNLIELYIKDPLKLSYLLALAQQPNQFEFTTDVEIILPKEPEILSNQKAISEESTSAPAIISTPETSPLEIANFDFSNIQIATNQQPMLETIISESKEEMMPTPEDFIQRTETETPVPATTIPIKEATTQPVMPHLPINLEVQYDYFKTQGIEITNEFPKINFGVQHQTKKTFLHWLKNYALKEENIVETDETKTSSKKETDKNLSEKPKKKEKAEQPEQPLMIYTETMAEILVYQGKIQSAIEIYTKLKNDSPEKENYFSEKIKTLTTKN